MNKSIQDLSEHAESGPGPDSASQIEHAKPEQLDLHRRIRVPGGNADKSEFPYGKMMARSAIFNAMNQNDSSGAPLCRVSDIPEGGVLGLDPAEADSDGLVLTRNGDAVRAWWNVCPHTGRRMDYAPNLFLYKNGQLTCAVHGATFALEQNGLCVQGPCRGESLTDVPLRVSDGNVWRA